MEEAPEQRRHDPVRRVGDDVERSAGQPEVGRVGTDDSHRRCEQFPETVGPTGMCLDRDDPMTGVDERMRDGAGARTDVEHERPLRQVGVSDEPTCDLGIELVPSPPPALPGHGSEPS